MKQKLLISLIIGFMILGLSVSIFILVKTLKGESKPVPNETVEQIDETVQIEDLDDTDNLDKIIENTIVDKTNDTSILDYFNQYSENYVSVVNWMVQELAKTMNKNGYTVDIQKGDEWVEVDGKEAYDSAEIYLVEYINTGGDIEYLFSIYCLDLYSELKNTYLLGSDSNEEYLEANSLALYNNLLTLYQKASYQEIMDKFENLLENYKFTMPYNYKICNIYQDAKSTLNYVDDLDAMNYGLSYMKNIDSYFINFCKLTDKQKIKIVKDNSSVIPFMGSVPIVTKTSYLDLQGKDKSFYNKYNNYLYYAKDVMKLDFYIKDVNLTYTSYVVKNYDGSFDVIKIEYTGNGDCIYKTARELYMKYYGTSTDLEESDE